MLALRDVLVPIDFEPTSYNALAYARDLASTFGARLHVLHVLEDSFALSAGTEGPLSDIPTLERQMADDARAGLNALLTEDDRKSGAIPVVLSGASPAASIVRYVEENGADIIVMGTHGRTAKALGALGSVAEQVVRTAPCPVVTVRRQAADGQPARRTHRADGLAVEGQPGSRVID
jgi:nucleotide-binding universal stress UspA family protein